MRRFAFRQAPGDARHDAPPAATNGRRWAMLSTVLAEVGGARHERSLPNTRVARYCRYVCSNEGAAKRTLAAANPVVLPSKMSAGTPQVTDRILKAYVSGGLT